jgi:hypothetical protein
MFSVRQFALIEVIDHEPKPSEFEKQVPNGTNTLIHQKPEHISDNMK